MSDQLDKNEATRPVHTGSAGSTQPVHLPPENQGGDPAALQRPVEATLPLMVNSDGDASHLPGEDVHSGKNPAPRRKIGRLMLVGIAFLLITNALGAFLGYQDGLTSRRNQQVNTVAQQAAVQFQLGLEDMAQDRLDLAKTRFEYIISLDPNFPGVQEKLVEVLFTLQMRANPTPTLEPTQTIEPTPDTSNEDTQWDFVLKQMAAKNWDAAIQAMDNLRKINLLYKPVDVDGLYFIALRYRGVDKMLRYSDLEGGIYDLSQAEKFSILDRDAEAWRTFSRLYLTGAAYWEVNWEKAMDIFAQVAPFLPNLRDGSGITAAERYRIAATKFAEIYIKDGAYCKAAKVYETILQMGSYSGLEPTATWLANRCNPPTKTPSPKTATPSPTSTLMETPTLPLPAPTTVLPTATPTPPPSVIEPTPSATN